MNDVVQLRSIVGKCYWRTFIIMAHVSYIRTSIYMYYIQTDRQSDIHSERERDGADNIVISGRTFGEALSD